MVSGRQTMTKKRTVKKSVAKKSAAAKKAARTRKAVKANTDAARKRWQELYGDRPAVEPAEPATVYDYAIQAGRR